MRQAKYIFLMLFLFFVGTFHTDAKENTLNSIDIEIHINDDASANITETWKMNVSEGTEVYKPMGDLTYSELSDFKVTDETGKVYTYKSTWNIDDSFSQKAYKNGINQTSDGIELCWGMSSYGKNTYKIEYKVTNFVMNVEDGQMIYWKLVNDSMNPAPEKVSIKISSNKYFKDTVPVWGYGYKGYAFVDNGKIYMETEAGIDYDEYMVLYATFDTNTFDAPITVEGTTQSWLKKANRGTMFFKFKTKLNYILPVLIKVLILISPILLIIIIKFLSSLFASKKRIPGIKCKKIKNKNLKYFRQIPCNNDIYRAYFIATLYKLNEKEADFLGAILLKWLNEEKISIIETPSNLLSQSKHSINLKVKEAKNFTNHFEKSLYEILTMASSDGVLEAREFGEWCSAYPREILGWFDRILAQEKGYLIREGHLTEIKKKFRTIQKKYQVQPSLRQEALELAGLKKFLNDFSNMESKDSIEVHLWEEYLIYAQMLGIAKKVKKQFKSLYPDLFVDIDYENIEIIDSIALNGITLAVKTGTSRSFSLSNSDSDGFGGYSSGGGGSFGGGSGGGTR